MALNGMQMKELNAETFKLLGSFRSSERITQSLLFETFLEASSERSAGPPRPYGSAFFQRDASAILKELS